MIKCFLTSSFALFSLTSKKSADIFKVVSTFCVPIPSHSDLSLVCKKFYEISCQTKFYQITAKMLLDDNSADLLMNSLKRFNSVSLSDDYLRSGERDRPLLLKKHIKLLKFVGEDIKSLCICGDRIIQIDSNLTSLLKLLPNLEMISLKGNVHFLLNEPKSQTTLHLPKLEELEIANYISDVAIFNHLPKDVLRKIHLYYFKLTLAWFKPAFSQLFNNQIRRLQEIRISNSLFPFIDFNALNSVTKAEVITNEPTDNLEPIFHGLKSLESLSLRIGSYISSEQTKAFENFQHLQTLCIYWLCSQECSHCLNGLSSLSITNLRINIKSFAIETQTLKALSRNLPQLEHLELSSKLPIEIINTIVGHFPNLKKLYFSTNHDRYVFQNNLKNESLNTLSIHNEGSLHMPENFPKLLAAYKNLKYFETTMWLDDEDIQSILKLEPTLNTLCLLGESSVTLSTNLVATLGMFGENLNEFSCNVRFEDEITEDFVRKYLNHKFKNIEFLIKLDGFYYYPEKFTLMLNNGFPTEGFNPISF